MPADAGAFELLWLLLKSRARRSGRRKISVAPLAGRGARQRASELEVRDFDLHATATQGDPTQSGERTLAQATDPP